MKAEQIDKDLETLEGIIREGIRRNWPMKKGWALIGARNALKKRKPMEPEIKNRMPRCSACGGKIYFVPYDHNVKTYCTHCGQAINWQNWKYKYT